MEPFAAYQQRQYTKGETEIIAAVGFDYDEIDRLLLEDHDPETPETQKLKADWDREGRSSASADLLRLTLESILPPGNLQQGTTRSMGLRCVCLLWMLQSSKHDLGSRSLADIAKKLGVSRAILSFHVRNLEEKLGFHCRGQKGVEARESYKETIQAGWETRREKHGATGRRPSRRSGGESPPV
jgi:DNA-binding CsgD family transcriptional regulator